MATLGIDLGTTTTLLAQATLRPEGLAADLLLLDYSDVSGGRRDRKRLESVVYVDESGGITVGRRAQVRLRKAGTVAEATGMRFLSNSKRDIGQDMLPYPTPLGPMAPWEVSSAVVAEALRAWRESAPGAPLDHLTVTVPASFGAYQRRSTRRAVRRALENLGLPVALADEPRLLLSEPIAALIAWISKTEAAGALPLDLSQPQKVLVYDIGGGTLDVALVRVERTDGLGVESLSIEVLEQGRYTEFGGTDLDAAVGELVHAEILQRVPSAGDIQLSTEERRRVRALLTEQGKQVKERLADEIRFMGFDQSPIDSDYDEILVNFADRLSVSTEHEFDASIELSWRQFEEAVKGYFESDGKRRRKHAINPIESLVRQAKDAGVIGGKQDIAALLAVGGSMLTPTVPLALEAWWDRPIHRHFSDEEAVACGAALYSSACANNPEFRIGEPPADAYWILSESGFKCLVSRDTGTRGVDHSFGVPRDCGELRFELYSGADPRGGPASPELLRTLRPERPLRLRAEHGFRRGDTIAVTVRMTPAMELQFQAECAGVSDGLTIEM